MHFFCGAWGVLSVGLFATKEYMGGASWGLLYGGGALQLGLQVVGLLALTAWAGCLSWVMFRLLSSFHLLRVPEAHEQIGLDITHHGGAAYNSDWHTRMANPALLKRFSGLKQLGANSTRRARKLLNQDAPHPH